VAIDRDRLKSWERWRRARLER